MICDGYTDCVQGDDEDDMQKCVYEYIPESDCCDTYVVKNKDCKERVQIFYIYAYFPKYSEANNCRIKFFRISHRFLRFSKKL